MFFFFPTRLCCNIAVPINIDYIINKDSFISIWEMWDINYISSTDPEYRAQDPSSKCNLNPCLQTLLVISQEFLCNHPVLCKDKESILAHIYISVQAVDIP